MENFIKAVRKFIGGFFTEDQPVFVPKKITFADITSGFATIIKSLKELENQSNSELNEIAGEQKILDERKSFATSELNNSTETAKNIKKLIPALDK